jgi:hypothetical protein
MILQSYDRRRRVALAPSPTTPEFLAEESLVVCQRIMKCRRMQRYWLGYHYMAALWKSRRLQAEDDVIIAANTLIKLNRREA